MEGILYIEPLYADTTGVKNIIEPKGEVGKDEKF